MESTSIMISNVKEKSYFAYFKVMKHDTAVTRISCNDLKPSITRAVIVALAEYALPADAEMFYGYCGLIEALEKAKDGAQKYIEEMIAEGDQGIPQLLQYRMDHYEDLGVNLVDGNIRKLETALKTDPDFKWIPYRIQS